MKQKLLLTIALLCAVAQGAWSENVVDLSTLTSDYMAQDGDVLTGTIENKAVVISIAPGASVTLRNANIIELNYKTYLVTHAGIECMGNATIILEGNNQVCGHSPYYPGIMPGPSGTTLTIKGDGALYAYSHGCAPGIGTPRGDEKARGDLIHCGHIIIEGGDITAVGGDGMENLDEEYGSPGIGCDRYSTLDGITLRGGTIRAYGKKCSAGIGECGVTQYYDRDTDCGTITIDGSTVYAYGGKKGAGIGTGSLIFTDPFSGGGDYGCRINILSGYVEAYGGSDAAGIGGGYNCGGGSITIEGGTIIAKGGSEAAGIGGGEDGHGGKISISGGDITAYGGDYAAGIGGGDGGGGGVITITGGTIKAYGGKDGAGIGGGEDGDSDFIIISGGNIYASGSGYGVGIGAGEDGDVVYIAINGGIVDAYGGLEIRRAIGGENIFAIVVEEIWRAIGGEDIMRAIGGEDAEDYSKIRIDSKMKATDASSEKTLNYVFRDNFLQGFIHLKFELCDHAGATYSIVDAEKHQCTCQWCGNFEEDHSYGDNGLCACGYGTETHKVHLYAVDSNHQYQEVSTLTVAVGNEFILPLTADTPSDYLFRCWLESTPDANDNGIMGNWGAPIEPGTTMTMGENDRFFMARYEAKNVNLGWIEENKVLKDGMVVSGKLEKNCMISIADGATVTLRDATILGTDDVDYMWGGINCQGDATIILEGENVVRGFYSFAPGIYVPQGKTLTIQGDGSLDASSNGYGAGIGGGSEYACGNIVINGGAIKATGGYQSAGIGTGLKSWCGDITISNKVISVTAIKGKDAPHSIGANDGITGTVTIGKVKTGPISESPYTYYPSLDVSGDMTADLEEVMGKTLDVTFRGRKFIIDSEWNTLCLPFSMTAEQISNSPLNNSKIVELDTEKTTLSDGVLTIAYKTATAIVAGKPYMVKWVIDEEAEDTHIDNPIFKNVTISTAEPTAVSAAGITFCGTFAPLTLASGDKTRLWLDDDVRLRWVSGQDEQVSPTWCYWNLNGLDASTLNAIVVTFDDGSRPIVELMDGMTDFSILSAFGEQEVNASLEGRELSAVQQADGTWQSRAYTLCLPFYADLLDADCDFTIYSKAEVTQDGELLFTQEMLPFLNPGNAYLIVVNKGTLRLQEEGVTIIAEADEADEWENAVPFNYVDEQTAGYWLGSLKTIGHDEAVSRKAFTLASDGSFQLITDEHPTWKWPAFRAMFCATDLMTADKLTTKYQLDANGEEEEDRSLPAPDSYQGDNDGEATGIAPVIHTIDRDGTERWFDLNGRQLSGKPTKKGVYIHRGKKQVVK